MTFAQAAELTIPQLLHVLEIDPRAASPGRVAAQLEAARHGMLDRIAARRGHLPAELLRLPVSDLLEQIKAETGGHAPAISQLGPMLAKYAAGV